MNIYQPLDFNAPKTGTTRVVAYLVLVAIVPFQARSKIMQYDPAWNKTMQK
jgi:hypothetical protein